MNTKCVQYQDKNIMDSLYLIAVLYIFVGGLGFLLNIIASTFLTKLTQKPLKPLTVYGLSDTLCGTLTGISLLCDGCVYIANVAYRNSCSRYFLIYTLVLLPVVTSSFSALGIATENYRMSVVARPRARHWRRRLSTAWCLASWVIAGGFVIVVWAYTQVVPINGKLSTSSSYWHNNAIRYKRGLLSDLWEYNSQHDWSTDYRESVIIGLVYGITGGNISHTDLERYHGITRHGQRLNLDIIKNLHTALGITEEDQQRVFGELVQQTQNVHNSTVNKTDLTLPGAGNSPEVGNQTDITNTEITSSHTTNSPATPQDVQNNSSQLSNLFQTPQSIADISTANTEPITNNTELNSTHVQVVPTHFQIHAYSGSSGYNITTETTNILGTRGNVPLTTNKEQQKTFASNSKPSTLHETPVTRSETNTSSSVSPTVALNTTINPQENKSTTLPPVTLPSSTTCQAQVKSQLLHFSI